MEIIEDSLNDLTNKEANSTSCITFLKTSAVLATSYVVFIHLKQKSVDKQNRLPDINYNFQF